MAEAKSNTIETSPKPELHRSNGSPVRSSSFKYYIHDSVNTCRLQLLGELNEMDLPELDGCWQTIRTTLRSRPLVLDLRRLDGADPAGNRWLTGMATEGATYLPDSYLQQTPAKKAATNGKAGLFTRILGVLRGGCMAGAD